ncbi:unnamed protein product (macronuclear) [Paramecium tetraurelia]|uniref:Protein kinase domain-containing protein n=1 Tax=Paramecium tetraurelia TaxID=5888 RepID=A0BW59_PARTE|nr:uncharacterized protein GSPATT00032628001 [Paramecium tetraurelia]CAK62776.1 unnamed protein product [Paramecium tetraurelia]|eukprot:XP_001430174.1 hypothetical protein (macronuclear) [Paramecium tetraurelia strain d4-2]
MIQNQNYEVHKIVGKKKYEILVRVLGQGQYAKTYLARNIQTQQYLACKVISKEQIVHQLNQIENREVAERKKQKITERLQNEVDNTSKMSHPHIVKFEDLVESPNNIYFFMEYCSGGTLEKLIQNRKRLSQADALPYFKQLALGCGYLYEKNVIHRDLKPSNVLLQDNVIKIADFGLSKAMEEQIKEIANDNTPWIGTPLYMSPQVIGQEQYSIKSDVWSLGCIFYEMLCGRTPYYHEKVQYLQLMIQNENVQFPNDVQISENMKKLITMMLAKTENARISIVQVIEYLEQV